MSFVPSPQVSVYGEQAEPREKVAVMVSGAVPDSGDAENEA